MLAKQQNKNVIISRKMKGEEKDFSYKVDKKDLAIIDDFMIEEVKKDQRFSGKYA